MIEHSDNEDEPVFWSVDGINHGKLYNNPDEVCVYFNNEDRDYNTEEKRLDWINWMKLNIDKVNNSVSLNISNGDPRKAQIELELKKTIKQGEQFTYEINVNENSLPYSELIGSCNINLTCLKFNKNMHEDKEKLKQELSDANNKIKELNEKIKKLEKK